MKHSQLRITNGQHLQAGAQYDLPADDGRSTIELQEWSSSSVTATVRNGAALLVLGAKRSNSLGFEDATFDSRPQGGSALSRVAWNGHMSALDWFKDRRNAVTVAVLHPLVLARVRVKRADSDDRSFADVTLSVRGRYLLRPVVAVVLWATAGRLRRSLHNQSGGLTKRLKVGALPAPELAAQHVLVTFLTEPSMQPER